MRPAPSLSASLEASGGLSELTRELVSAAFENDGRSTSCSPAQAKRDNTLAFWDDQANR